MISTESMREGIIISGVSSFYDVYTPEGTVRCKARGSFRKQQVTPVIGDRVLFSEKQYLEEVLPRNTYLIRPPVANADQAVLVMAVHSPEPSFFLMDRFLAQTLQQKMRPVLVFNKWDLAEPEDTIHKAVQIYRDCGFTVLCASAREKTGLEEVLAELQGHLTVFAGPSGAGKSSLLNCLIPGLSQETGGLSEKIQRGKNTTRHARLIPLENGGFAADTPGFTSLDLGHLQYEELEQYYPEFQRLEDACRFRGCSHVSEPDCAVRQAVRDGVISRLRYRNYVALYQEIRKENEENRYT